MRPPLMKARRAGPTTARGHGFTGDLIAEKERVRQFPGEDAEEFMKADEGAPPSRDGCYVNITRRSSWKGGSLSEKSAEAARADFSIQRYSAHLSSGFESGIRHRWVA